MAELLPGRSPRSSGIAYGVIILLILSVPVYGGMMGSLLDSGHSDPAGRGLAVAFGAMFSLVLFLLLSLLLLVAALKGRMSLAGKIASFLVLPAAITAIWLAADAYSNRDSSAIWVPALLPPAIAAYALRARFDSLRTLASDLWADLAFGFLIALLIAAPFVRVSLVPAREAANPQEEQARQEREEHVAREAREKEAAAFAALGPESPMADYLPFLFGNHAREARQGIRQVRSRQADTVALLAAGRLRELSGLLEFDVDATPPVCAAYRDALARETAKVDRKVTSHYLGIALELEWQLPNLQWLTGEGCDLMEPLAQLEKNLRAVADSQRIVSFADKVAAIRSRSRP